MRKWGIVVSVFYVLILLGFLVPAFVLLAESQFYGLPQFLHDLAEAYGSWFVWLTSAILVSGQVLLLFVSVDTTQKRLKPRAHILVSCLAASILTAVLTFAIIGSIGVAIRGDRFGEGSFANPFVFFGGLWIAWAIAFYFYFRNSSEVVTRLMSWLLKGSILELLVAVPCHVIVRRRHDCSAPAVTSFGIVTGIAIMLLSFGPSVLFLYKKRLDAYASRPSA
jgi:hypothetical protein